ncbi:hypothetical protein LINGRAHAP2_LOCUS25636 [Linum grandiflorum]
MDAEGEQAVRGGSGAVRQGHSRPLDPRGQRRRRWEVARGSEAAV